VGAEAGSLTCPRCGAPAAPEAPCCAHCGTALALVSCPACFGRIFKGARFCSHCGAEAARREDQGAPGSTHACPRCRQALARIAVGKTTLEECPGCGGLWSDRAALERMLTDAEAQAAVQGRPAGATLVPSAQRYVPCPECARLMNRVNFARCSGVIVDVCRQHGTWLDRDELQRIVGFVRQGGLTQARDKEREELALARRSLHQQELILAARQRSAGGPDGLRGSSGGSNWGPLDGADLLEAVTTVGSAVFDLFD